MTGRPLCELCGEPMPDGEGMFKIHGYSGNCPKPPKAAPPMTTAREVIAKARYNRRVMSRALVKDKYGRRQFNEPEPWEEADEVERETELLEAEDDLAALAQEGLAVVDVKDLRFLENWFQHRVEGRALGGTTTSCLRMIRAMIGSLSREKEK